LRVWHPGAPANVPYRYGFNWKENDNEVGGGIRWIMGCGCMIRGSGSS